MSKPDNSTEYFARCAGGFEQVLADELRGLRMRRVRPLKGGVAFFGELADGYRACLWSRVATRIQLVLARVDAADADELYQAAADLAWEQHVRPGATIAVDAHGRNDHLVNSRFVALKVKDAICDRLRTARGARPDVDPRDPDLAIDVALHQQRATLYLNLSGASLHRRGYRADGVQTEAPLKETLAASILLAAGWPDAAAAGGMLVDPMCGSGTLAIEAALIVAQGAPGLLRERWGFEGWLGHDPALWESLRTHAQLDFLPPQGRPPIIAGDIDPAAVQIARDNAQRAGVASLIRFHVDDAARLTRHLHATRHAHGGLLVANPPYGQRLLSQRDLPEVNAALAQAVEALPTGWQVALITPDTSVDTALGRTPDRTIACHNGPLEAHIRLYQDAMARRTTLDVVSLGGTQQTVAVAEPASAQFATRLRKVAKERTRWARKASTSAFRVYDADLPDYALSVDLYLGAGPDEGQRYALVEEHRRPKSVDALLAAHRLSDAAALVAATLDVPARNVLVRAWESERDARRRNGDEGLPLAVSEDGFAITIDLRGRPDTGLPLALRGVRELVGTRAAGQHVVSLFASSGVALLHAAAAGAASTTCVDAFADRVDAVRAALEANGFSGKRYRLACADARTWLEREACAGHAYDLVVCTPPSWLAPRDKADTDWELQRDHVTLLRQATRILSPTGAIVFACEARDLRLDADALRRARLAIADVSGQTLPHDFERSARQHHCYLLERAR